MSENEKKIDLIYGELLNRCWKDENYLERFRKEPAAVLAESGIPVKAGAVYHVMEQSKDKLFLILPQNFPAEKMEKLDELKAEIKVKAGLGEDAVIVVLQNTDTDVYLPYYPAPKIQPLSDDELAAVAGSTIGPKPVGPVGPDTTDPNVPEDPPFGPDVYTYTQNYVYINEQIALGTEVLFFLATIG